MNNNEEKKNIWKNFKDRLTQLFSPKMIFFSVNAGLFLTGLMLVTMCVVYKKNNIPMNNEFERYVIGSICLGFAYVMFPFIDDNKKNKIEIYFLVHISCVIISAFLFFNCASYYLSNISSANFLMEIYYTICSLFVLSYISYILINFGIAIYKALKNFLSKSKKVDEVLENATNKLDGLNNLIATITALVTSVTPIIIAVLAFVKGGG